MKTNDRPLQRRRRVTWILGLFIALCVLAIPDLSDARRRCRKDADCDGLTNQQERQLGTKRSSADTDRDGLSDGLEVNVLGSDPKDADSDDDGIDDAHEVASGTDFDDDDSDDDGIPDGEDCDPEDDLDSKIEGAVQAIACPTDVTDGSIKVLGITVKLTANSEFDDPDGCAGVAMGAHVELEVTGDAETELVADEVENEDGDNDGCVDDEEDEEGGQEGEDDPS